MYEIIKIDTIEPTLIQCDLVLGSGKSKSKSNMDICIAPYYGQHHY